MISTSRILVKIKLRLLIQLVIITIAMPLATGCRQEPAIAISDTFSTPGSPSSVYERLLSGVRPLLHGDTSVIRTDAPDGIIARFPVRTEKDSSVHLIEVSLKPGETNDTRVTVRSKTFAFTSSSKRNAVDLELEQKVRSIIERAPAKE